MRYGQYMKESMRLERLEQECDNYERLLGDLTNHWMTYATHRDTGLVYDTDIIKHNLANLRMEISHIKELIDDEQ
jgi:hypothetical protein